MRTTPLQQRVSQGAGKLCIYLGLFFLCFSLTPIHSPYAASKKKEPGTKQESTPKVPSSIKKRVEVLSNMNQEIISPLLDFIDTQTGLQYRLSIQENFFFASERHYDLFIGTCPQVESIKISRYKSKALSSLDPALYANGVLVWSRWYSCIAVNRLFSEEIDFEQKKLKGKITSVKLENDRFMWLVLYTLYRKYGKAILEDINALIPLYKESRQELIFTIESGGYPSVLGIDGYFKKSIEKGYPIDIFYSSFSPEKYPSITVAGENVAFIPEGAENTEGAGYVLDYLTGSAFQSFLLQTPFWPVLHSDKEEPKDVIPIECDMKENEAFETLWREIAFPEIIQEIVEEM